MAEIITAAYCGSPWMRIKWPCPCPWASTGEGRTKTKRSSAWGSTWSSHKKRSCRSQDAIGATTFQVRGANPMRWRSWWINQVCRATVGPVSVHKIVPCWIQRPKTSDSQCGGCCRWAGIGSILGACWLLRAVGSCIMERASFCSSMEIVSPLPCMCPMIPSCKVRCPRWMWQGECQLWNIRPTRRMSSCRGCCLGTKRAISDLRSWKGICKKVDASMARFWGCGDCTRIKSPM